MIEQYEFSMFEQDKLDNISQMHLLYTNNIDSYYAGRWSVFKRFRNLKEITVEGMIDDLTYLNYLPGLDRLTIKVEGDLSEFLSDLVYMTSLRSIKKFVVFAEKINYLCSRDFSNMEDLQWLEIHCSDTGLELDFEDLSFFRSLTKLVFEVDMYLAMEIREKRRWWEEQIPGIEIDCKF